jgi:Family of unknown function (DUF6603)
MPDQPGTIEQLLTHLANALAPFADELSPALLQDLGIGIPAAWNAQVQSSLRHVSSAARALPPAVQDLAAASSGGNAAAIIAKSVVLGVRIAEFAASANQLGVTLTQAANTDGALTVAQKARFTASLTNFFGRLAELAALRTLEKELPQLAALLDLTGIATSTVTPGVPGDFTAPPHVRRGFDLNKIVDLFKDPSELARDLYQWGDPGFDGRAILIKLQRYLQFYELPAMLIEAPGQPPILESMIVALQADNTVAPPGMGFELRLPATYAVSRPFDLPDPWSLEVSFTGSYAAGLQGLAQSNGNFKVRPPTGTVNATASASLIGRKPSGAMQIIGLPGGTRLEVAQVTAGVGVTVAFDTATGTADVSPEVTAALDRMKLVISLSGGDGFLQSAIPTSAIEAEFSLSGRLNRDGFAVTGSGRIEVLMPTHISLGPLEIQSICFVARLFDPDPVTLELSAGLKFSLGPLVAVVERMGAKGAFKLPPSADGNAGPVQFELGFKPPEGVGLSIDAGAVRGGGYLYFNFEDEEYAGVLQLKILELVSITAIALITTRMPDGSSSFSLLVIISVEFVPGIQLGLGFTLIGLGGLLGLNRTMLLEPLMNGVRTGTINSIMFPQGDIIANAPRIISDLRAIFPPYVGKFLIGPMAKLGWGTPTIVSVSLGVIIEIPGNIAIIGILRLALPTPDAALIIIQVAFAGAIEFDRKRLFFFATLFDSRILFLTLEGGMGLLLAWGDDPSFVFSVGGFHPRFTPPPLPFPSPDRLAITLLNTPTSVVRITAYFAVTSNTVQIGAAAEIRFGFEDFGIEGHLGFDALFQFSPFYFIIEVNISLRLNVFGLDVLSVRVELTLEGPSPWRARGTGHVSLLFFEISADFDVTWGDRAETTLPPIAVLPLLQAEFDKKENWTASLPAGRKLMVALRAATEMPNQLVMHPLGSLRVSQRLLPLALALDKFGTQTPSDAKRFELLVSGGGLAKIGDAREKFAMAQFVKMDDATKLSRPSYESGNGGLELSAAGAQMTTSHMARRVVRYEIVLIDGEFRKHIPKGVLSAGLFAHHLAGSAVTLSPLSASYRSKLDPFPNEKVKVKGEAYTIVDTDTNRVVGGVTEFASSAAAHGHLQTLQGSETLVGRNLEVVPVWEATQ